MMDVLDEILLGDNVVANFLKAYKKDDFRSWILSVLPEIEECKNLKQDNPWHVYNCLEHILHSVENMNKKTINMDGGKRRLLAYTMFLHDIGKPACLVRRYSKLYKREVDSFFNHNIKSVEIAKRVLNEFGFSLYDQELIKKLILEHDMFMFITLKKDNNSYHHLLTEKYLIDKIKEFNSIGKGIDVMKYLLLVGRSDNEAQNPNLTSESFNLLNVMEKMINNVVNKKI